MHGALASASVGCVPRQNGAERWNNTIARTTGSLARARRAGGLGCAGRRAGWQYPLMVRPLPARNPSTNPFWTAGADGVLRLPKCTSCGVIRHPSLPICRDCNADGTEWVDLPGTGVVAGFSVNHQPFLPTFPPTYVVAIVELDGTGDAVIRLTTNVIDADPDDVHVGMPVAVRFEHQDDTWIPLFVPLDGPDKPVADGTPRVNTRPPATADRFEDRVVISGIGKSAVGRRLMRVPLSLSVEAAQAAIADAGLTAADIDGLSTYPGASIPGGMTEGGINALENVLQLQPVWFNGGLEIPGMGGAIQAAMLAVASGQCRHVLCVRTVWEASNAAWMRSGELSPPGGGRAGGEMQWLFPFGAAAAPMWLGPLASAYMHRYGVDRTVFGRIAVNARNGAARNPDAIYRDPLTIDDYFGARMVSSPFGLYDCDVPCDASIAVVVSAADHAADAPNGAVRVQAVGSQMSERPSFDQATLTHEPLVFGAAAHMWTRTDLRPDDVDVALLYDGFTFNCLSWLEGLGFCGIGEATDFVGDGSTIALGGALPLNPHGGQLSAGRTHGFGFFHEAVTQLRGAAGERQVEGCKLAVVATGGLAPAGCMLLSRPD